MIIINVSITLVQLRKVRSFHATSHKRERDVVAISGEDGVSVDRVMIAKSIHDSKELNRQLA